MANLSSYLPDGIDESSVQITGGTINGTTIGASTAAAGTFTTVTGSGDLVIDTDTLFVDVSADKVGIGTTTPAEDLNIVGASGTAKIRFDGDSSNLQNNFIGITGYDDLTIASDEANSGTDSTIKFRIDAAEYMQLTHSGHLMVGLQNNSNHSSRVKIVNGGASGYEASLDFCYEDKDTVKARINTDSSGAILEFHTYGSSLKERMRLDDNGRIGLGDQPATVNGLLTLQSDSYYSNLVELYGSGDKKTYISGRFGILGNNSFVTKIGGVYSGYAGLSFDYYYLYPLIQETMNNGDLRLGSSSYRFHTLYSVNGTSTSDERVKEEVENLDVGLDFIKSLQPKKFKYKDKDEEGNYKDGRLDQPDGVKKWGLIAQDVKQVLDDNSITEDLGLWSVDKGECNGEILEDQQQLQYQELIAPLINAVKEQQVLIETLQTEVAELKAN